MSSVADSTARTGSSAGAHEIPWQTLFYWMASFAVNSAAQSTGRVLWTSYKHQAILRGSPIFCAFDALATLGSWLRHVICSQSRFSIWNIRVAATRVILRRVVDKDNNPDFGEMHSIRANSRLRWIAVAVTALPTAVKLYGSRGIPLSQAVGTMYLASWLIFEILFIVAKLDYIAFEEIEMYPTEPSWPTFRQPWAFAAVLCHTVLYGQPVTSTNSETNTSQNLFWNGQLLSFLYPFLLWRPCMTGEDDLALSGTGGVFAYLTLIGIAGIKILVPLVYMLERTAGLSDSRTFNIIFPVCAAVVVVVVAVLCYRRRLGVAHGVRLLDLIVYPYFVYAFLYDASGTYQPSWFIWFG
ncbi:hypothetical protein BJX99DRAFT_218439 [Aspergillus californicus]